MLYFKRRGWPTKRFESQELSEAFWAEYARILNAKLSTQKAFLVRGLIARRSMLCQPLSKTKALSWSCHW